MTAASGIFGLDRTLACGFGIIADALSAINTVIDIEDATGGMVDGTIIEVADAINPCSRYKPATMTRSIAKRGGGRDDILFGQEDVGRKFQKKSKRNRWKHAGKSIAEVAKDLRSGAISPDEVPIEFVIVNGRRVAVNNRSLTAFRRAGMKPTNTTNVTGDKSKLNDVMDRLSDMGGAPSETIRIRGHSGKTIAIF